MIRYHKESQRCNSNNDLKSMLQADASDGYVDQSNPRRFVHRLRDGRIESFRPLRADHQLDGLRRIAQMRQKFLLVFCHVGPGWAMLGNQSHRVTPMKCGHVDICGTCLFIPHNTP